MITKNPLKYRSPGELPKFPNIMVGGVAGVGKTGFIGTVGPENKVLIVDSENGSVSYQSAWFRDEPTAAKLENLHVIGTDGAGSAQELVQIVEGALDHLIRTKNSDGYALFALDSITEFQEQFLKLHRASDPRQSYGAFKEALHGIVHKARQAPIVTVFTARLKAVQDEVLAREIVRPAMAPGAWEVISGLFDQIGLLDLKVQGQSGRRNLDFSPRPRFQGKDRYGLGEIAEPRFVNLLAKLNGEAPKTANRTPARKAAPAAARR